MNGSKTPETPGAFESAVASVQRPGITRRNLLGAAAALALLRTQYAAYGAGPAAPPDTYETQAKGIRLLPGQWRPHYPWEHIAWVSPAWPSQDYIWMDFPEAIFTSQGLIFLSHINPGIEAKFENLPRVAWAEVRDGISFERALPNGIVFSGSLRRADPSVVELTLSVRNGSTEPLNDIEMQTCAYLRGIREFGDYTRENKFVHVRDKGWVTMGAARELPEAEAPYRLGWRSKGKRLLDVPMAVTVSNRAERLFAYTWHEDTLSIVDNYNHPCVHADPRFPDLEPGASATVKGSLIFFEGKLDDFDYTRYQTPRKEVAP